MKKSIIFCLCVTIVTLFASCNKDNDGIFNPAKKIHKIFEVNEVYGTYVSEVWNWNGNQLSSINKYNHRGDLYATTTYHYDGDRLITVRNESSYATFNYKGNKIDYINVYFAGDDYLKTVYTFQYKGNKLSHLNIDNKFTISLTDKKSLVNPLKFILPEVYASVEKLIEKSANESKGAESITMDFTWTGKNITSVVTNMFSDHYASSEVTECTFDHKQNPVEGFLGSISGSGNLYCNQNNLLSATTTSFGTPFSTTTYDYEYEGNYPVKMTVTTTYQDLYEGIIPDVVTYIYEY